MTQYCLAILPSPEITRFVLDFNRDFPMYLHTTLPPHLTVLPPFTIQEISNEKFLSQIISAVSKNPPLNISLDKVDVFKGRNNVVFLSPSSESNSQILQLSQRLLLFHQKTESESVPHLTLAQHIPKKEFPNILFEAKKRFSPMSFICKSISLFKNSGQGWEKVKDIHF